MRTRIITVISVILLSSFFVSFAQEEQEKAKPTFGVKLERVVSIAFIEDKTYEDVTVEIDAASIDDIFHDGVKITVKDINKKNIYKKRFSKSYLYGFSDNTLQVGKGNVLTQVIIYKNSYGIWVMKLKEKGIY